MPGVLDVITPVTIANYARGAWDNVSQNNPAFKEMKKRGAIEYDVGGDTIEGPIEAGRYAPIISAPGMDLTAEFVVKQRHKRYSHSWGECAIASVIDRGAMRRNSGDQALVKIRDVTVPAMWRDLLIADNGLAHQFLNMNGAVYTGTGLPFYGLPSCLLQPAATGLQGFDGISTVTGTTPADTDMEVTAGSTSQTYGGLSLERSGLTGVDGLEPDAWTPTLINSSATAFSGTADDEANAMLKLTQYGVDRMSRFSQSDPSMRPSNAVGSFNFFRMMGALLAAKQTIYIDGGSKATETANLGYGQHKLMHAGLEWFWDENCPASTWYILNYNKMKLKLEPLYKDQENGSPIKTSGEDAGLIEANINFDPYRRQWLISGTIPGQFVFNPRYQCRISAYS